MRPIDLHVSLSILFLLPFQLPLPTFPFLPTNPWALALGSFLRQRTSWLPGQSDEQLEVVTTQWEVLPCCTVVAKSTWPLLRTGYVLSWRRRLLHGPRTREGSVLVCPVYAHKSSPYGRFYYLAHAGQRGVVLMAIRSHTTSTSEAGEYPTMNMIPTYAIISGPQALLPTPQKQMSGC